MCIRDSFDAPGAAGAPPQSDVGVEGVRLVFDTKPPGKLLADDDAASSGAVDDFVDAGTWPTRCLLKCAPEVSIKKTTRMGAKIDEYEKEKGEGRYPYCAFVGDSLRASVVCEDAEAFCVRFSPDDTLLAAGCGDGVVRVFHTEDGRLAYKLEACTSGLPTTAIRFRPTSAASKTRNVLLAANSDGTVQHWHITSQRCLHTVTEEDNQVYALDYQHDGARFEVLVEAACAALPPACDGAAVEVQRPPWLLQSEAQDGGAERLGPSQLEGLIVAKGPHDSVARQEQRVSGPKARRLHVAAALGRALAVDPRRVQPLRRRRRLHPAPRVQLVLRIERAGALRARERVDDAKR